MKNKNKRPLFSNRKPSVIRRWIRRLIYFTLALVVLAAATIYFILSSSLPTYSGNIETAGLKQPVTINRDNVGTAEIIAANRLDLAFALGFTHAQDRFFQMDLLRRSAAGELSELIGNATVNLDKRVRQHRFRVRSRQVVDNLPAEQKQLLSHYTNGVNQGLAQLTTSPFEYWLLNAEPIDWRIEDSVLVVYAMYLDLQPSGIEREKVLEQAYAALPEDIYRELIPLGTQYDAPLDNSPTVSKLTHTKATNKATSGNQTGNNDTETSANDGMSKDKSQLMEEDGVENTQSASENSRPDENEVDNFPGSNNFAIGGDKSTTGSAIVAGDMHLGHGVPNIWFKANLQYPNPQTNQPVKLYGVTLPGTPLLIAGTNNDIAWAFTNSYGDYSDVISVELDADDPNRYVYQNTAYQFKSFQELIRVKGQPAIALEVRETLFGPVIETDKTQAYSLLWVAHQPAAVNLNLLQLETIDTAETAMAVANRSAIPAQNFVVGDKSGNLGWTIIGPLPDRNSSPSPVSTIDQQQGVIKWLDPDQYPRIYNPESDALWTANNRIVGAEALTKIGDGGFANGARALAIKQQLMPMDNADEKALLKVQLSTEAPLYKPWRKHILSLLQDNDKLSDVERQVKNIVTDWNGRSDKEQAGFTLLKKYRLELSARLLNPLSKKLSPEAKYGFRYYSKQYEALLWNIINRQPDEYLPKKYSSYKALFESTLNDIISELTANNQVVADQLWGNYNRLKIQHPISRAVPLLSRWLDRPNYAMPGDAHSPRVQSPTFGASQRFVISPGNIDSAIYHMPGGQSGHPMSEYYEAGFTDWVEGRPSPLKIQDIKHQLRLSPK